MTRLPRRIRAFRRDEDGSLSVEAALILPLLLWCFLATFQFFDAYRENAINSRAAFTISDMISREDRGAGGINGPYLTSMQRLMNFLTDSPNPVRIRVTIFTYRESDDTYRRVWSRQRGGIDNHTHASINAMRNRLPIMPDGEHEILFESWTDYQPRFNIGMQERTIYKVVVTRPRYMPTICWHTQTSCFEEEDEGGT